jgi:hypothetical protein
MDETSFEPLEGERLHGAVRRVLETIPFYAAYSREDGEGWFSRLPVLRRDDLSGVDPSRWLPPGLDVAAALASGALRPLTTSGSTDEPLKVYADTTLALPPNVWSMHGLPDDAKLISLTAPVCLGTHCPGDIAPHGPNGLLLTFRAGLFRASDDSIRRAVAAWNEFEPEIAFVNPVWLHWLWRRATELGLKLSPPRLISLTYQYPSHCQRRALAAAFDAPQVEFYGASEFGGTDLAIGCECGHLHLVEYQASVELVPSEHAGHDELVFSTPLSKSMPLIRYAPGDLGFTGRVEEGACSLWGVPVVELDGRVSEVLRTSTGVVTPRAFDDAVGELEGLEFYVARSRAGRLTVQCIVSPGSEARVEEALRFAVAPLGFEGVSVAFVQRLELGASGKLQLTGEDERNALEVRPSP